MKRTTTTLTILSAAYLLSLNACDDTQPEAGSPTAKQVQSAPAAGSAPAPKGVVADNGVRSKADAAATNDASPCLTTVHLEQPGNSTKPRRVHKFVRDIDGVSAELFATYEGTPSAPAPIEKSALLAGEHRVLGKNRYSVEMPDTTAATYEFDDQGRMVKAAFDPPATSQDFVVTYHYKCDAALVASAGEQKPEIAAPTATPANWKPVVGDPTGVSPQRGTFFVPPDWVVDGKPPRQSVWTKKHADVGCELAAVDELERAQDPKALVVRSAKKYATDGVKQSVVRTNATELLVLEYFDDSVEANRGGHYIEAWSFGDAPGGVICVDADGSFEDVRPNIELIARSYTPFAGERG